MSTLGQVSEARFAAYVTGGVISFMWHGTMTWGFWLTGIAYVALCALFAKREKPLDKPAK